MENHFRLNAVLARIDVLRHTPAGIPVLDVLLRHESWQEENGMPCLVKFDLPAKIVGKQAEIWQNRQGCSVCASGFIAQRGRNSSQPVLRIQTIRELRN